MIIGSGMLAKVFSLYHKNNDFVIFASGVANSKEIRDSEFKREESLLLDTLNNNKEKAIVYFSTCSMADPSRVNSAYVAHKKRMEELVSEYAANYHIFRLPIVVGKTNNSTIVNYFYQKIINNEPFELWTKGSRNLIDCDDVFKIIDYILSERLFKNGILNVASPYTVSIKTIVEILENNLNKKAIFCTVAKGARYEIDISSIIPIMEHLNIVFGRNYAKTTIEKYFSKDRDNETGFIGLHPMDAGVSAIK